MVGAHINKELQIHHWFHFHSTSLQCPLSLNCSIITASSLHLFSCTSQRSLAAPGLFTERQPDVSQGIRQTEVRHAKKHIACSIQTLTFSKLSSRKNLIFGNIMWWDSPRINTVYEKEMRKMENAFNCKGYRTISGSRMRGNLGECKWRVFLIVWQYETLMRSRKIIGSSLVSAEQFLDQLRIGWLDKCWLLPILSIFEILTASVTGFSSSILPTLFRSHCDFLSKFLRCVFLEVASLKSLWSKYIV